FLSGAVSGSAGDAPFFERHFSRKTCLREFDVTAKRVINTRGASNFSGGRPDVVDLTAENQVLDLCFDLIVEFVAVVPEKFDAVVFVRVVRGGKNNAGIGAERAGNRSQARGG